jgi:hypothetical protein
METAIIATQPLINRSTKREFYRQANKLAGPLQKVIDDFILALSFYPKRYSYQQIYEFYLNLWNEEVEHAMQQKHLTMVGIDRQFFAREYRPQI